MLKSVEKWSSKNFKFSRVEGFHDIIRELEHSKMKFVIGLQGAETRRYGNVRNLFNVLGRDTQKLCQ